MPSRAAATEEGTRAASPAPRNPEGAQGRLRGSEGVGSAAGAQSDWWAGSGPWGRGKQCEHWTSVGIS